MFFRLFFQTACTTSPHYCARVNYIYMSWISFVFFAGESISILLNYLIGTLCSQMYFFIANINYFKSRYLSLRKDPWCKNCNCRLYFSIIVEVYFPFIGLISRVGLKNTCESQHHLLCLFGRPTDELGKITCS